MDVEEIIEIYIASFEAGSLIWTPLAPYTLSDPKTVIIDDFETYMGFAKMIL